MSKQPDALRLAERADYWSGVYPLGCETAIELRTTTEALKQVTAERDALKEELRLLKRRLQEIRDYAQADCL